jgi:hypothetical protein
LDRLVAGILEYGLYRYYGLGSKAEIAVVGHSHLMLGVDKDLLEKELQVDEIAKYTREGVNVTDRYYMIQQLLENNKNLSTVIYGVDAWTFTGEGLSQNSHKLFYPFLDDPGISDYVKANDDFIDFLTKKTIKTTRYNEQLISGAFRGLLGKWDNLKFGKVDVSKLKQELEQGIYRRINNAEENITYFENTLEILKENKINVILVYIPTIKELEYNQQEAFDETIELFKSYKSDNVQFINLQDPWSKDYELFYDPIHLNPSGQKIITKELSKRIKP